MMGLAARIARRLRKALAEPSPSPGPTADPPAVTPTGLAPRPYYYLGENRALTQLSNGLPFYINTRDRGIASWIVLAGVWETFVDDVLCALCEPGMRVCDLGANLGYYTIKLANLVGPAGHVLSLEPNPELYPFLRDSVELNGFNGRVRAENLAVGRERGLLTLTYADVNMGGGNLFGMPAHLQPRTAEVAVIALDELVAGEPGFDLIKIDVEGWEPHVLDGMQEVLARSTQASLVLEVSWAQWSLCGDPAARLRSVIGERDGVFIIHHDGMLERVPLDELDKFHTAGVSYALLTHLTPERKDALRRFLPLEVPPVRGQVSKLFAGALAGGNHDVEGRLAGRLEGLIGGAAFDQLSQETK